ncbi:MAG TPA: hypothetical protein VFV27_06510, partial [Nevskiaceae bacterium]|nr:hypothetical protein [Nevskiaceae bacterium]
PRGVQALEVTLSWANEFEVYSLELIGPDGLSAGYAGFQLMGADDEPRGTPSPGATSLTVTVTDPKPGFYRLLVKEELTANNQRFTLDVDTICPESGCPGAPAAP